MIKAVEY